MTGKRIFQIAAAVIGAGALAAPAFAFGGRGHHRSSAMGLCMGVMSSTQRANLHSILSNSRETLKTDHQNVQKAREAITHDILYGTSVTSDEGNLAQAQAKLQSDEDSLAAQVCKNVTNITAVQTLYGQLQGMQSQQKTLREQAHGDFKAARSAQ